MSNNNFKFKHAAFNNSDLSRVKLAITDIDGVLRGKYISKKKFDSVINSSSAFCDCVFGWDVADTLYDNAKFTGWHTAYPDAPFKIDRATERYLPDENLPFFLGDFLPPDGEEYHPVCPRNLLKKILEKANTMGFGANLAFEYEFFLFLENSQSVRDKNYRNLTPLTPGMFGYSTLRSSTYSELFNDFMDYFEALNVPIEGLHCETGPGVWEAALEYDEALESADRASVFKTFAKVFFQKQGMIPTFMARWNLDYPGQSGHMHQSLYDIKTKENVFFNPSDKNGMTSIMKSYTAGQVKYLKSFLALTSPTINSYTRLVKGFWAPTAATWGVENRTTALRVIPGNEKSQRIEFRVGSADANPYLVAAAMLAAGLLGIEEGLTLSDPVVGSAYEVQDSLPFELQLPSSLSKSVENLKSCKKAYEVFGEKFIEHYVITREWEVREHEKAITDWQLQRYFEII